MVVPKECVPALIELNNRKLADTEEIMGTKIRMFPQANMQEIIVIKGNSQEKCMLARQRMIHAIDHYVASIKTETPVRREVNESDAMLDLATFYSEVLDRKVVK